MIKKPMDRPDWTPEQNEALREWNKAQLTYSQECKIFHRIRTMLPSRKDCDGVQLMMRETARIRYSQAAKAYNEARLKFQIAANPVKSAVDEMIQKLQSYISVLDASLVPSIKELRAQQHQHARYENDPVVQQLLKELQEKQLLEATSKGNTEGLGVSEDSLMDLESHSDKKQ